MGQPIDIVFPKGGVNEYTSYSEQPPQTTPESKNWVLRDPSTGRARGAQRAGTTRLIDDTTNGNGPVQCLVSINRQNKLRTYGSQDAPSSSNSDAEIQIDLEDQETNDCRAIDTDAYGNVYVVAGTEGRIAKYGDDGGLIWSHTVEMNDIGVDGEYQNPYCIRVDFDGSVYVGIGGTGGANDGRVKKYRQVETGLHEVWEIETPNNGLVADILPDGTWLYMLENRGTGSGTTLSRYGFVNTSRPLLLWEKELTWASHDVLDTYVGVSLALWTDGSAVVAYRVTDASNSDAKHGVISVVRPTGEEVASYGDGSTTGGCGNGVVVDEDGAIYSYGPAVGTAHVFVKLALTYSGSWSFALTYGSGGASADLPGDHLGPDTMAIDRDKRVYISVASTAGSDEVRLAAIDGSQGSYTLDWVMQQNSNPAVDVDGRCVAIDPMYPVPDDDATDGTKGPEFLWFGHQETGGFGLSKLRLLDVTQDSDAAPRSITLVSVSDGVVEYSSNSTGSWANWATASGESLNSSTKAFARAASGFDRVYLTDGTKYVVYNPEDNSTAIFRALKGRVPPRCKLITVWNNRLVLARDDQDPFNWYMSAINNFKDWEFFPYPQRVDQAVAGNLAPSGRVPDVVNCIIPYADDLLLVGGDHSIWRMTGDPADGGRWDLVTDVTGMIFGDAWCKDPGGVLYFMGATGGIYAYEPGSRPTEITSLSIRERFAQLIFSSYRFSLQWNDRERAVMVFCAKVNGTQSEHYQWDRDNGGWWPIEFSSAAAAAGLEPLVSHTIDGDIPGDRAVLLGCNDGYVRYWDVTATDDDEGATTEYAIESDVYIGPIMPYGTGVEARATKLHGIAGNSSAAISYQLFASDTPDFNDKGSAASTTTPEGVGSSFGPNRSAVDNLRSRGLAHWLRLYNTTEDERVQLETVRIVFESGSRVRVRS